MEEAGHLALCETEAEKNREAPQEFHPISDLKSNEPWDMF